MPTLTFRNQTGDVVDVPSVPSTHAQNQFRSVLDSVLKSGAVAITRHATPEAVLVSAELFAALVAGQKSKLESLTVEFDGLVASMQKPGFAKGMKAAFNGVPSLSVLDGWWLEGCIEGVTGWAIGDAASGAEAHSRAFYDKLEQVVLPLYYLGTDSGSWIKVMKGAISKNASYFNSHRMMRRYATEAYLR